MQINTSNNKAMTVASRFFVENLSITVTSTGNFWNNPSTTGEAGRIPQYILNNSTWNNMSPLVPLGQCYYSSSLTGTFSPGDVVHTQYLSSAGNFIVGDDINFAATAQSLQPSDYSNIAYNVLQILAQSGSLLNINSVNKPVNLGNLSLQIPFISNG